MFWNHYGGGYGGSLRLDPYVAIGVGMGFHYTAPSGWCIGIALPVLGATVIANSGYVVPSSSAAMVVGYYYLASAISLPVFSFGYRF